MLGVRRNPDITLTTINENLEATLGENSSAVGIEEMIGEIISDPYSQGAEDYGLLMESWAKKWKEAIRSATMKIKQGTMWEEIRAII